MSGHEDIRVQARRVSLFRLLLVAVALAVVVLTGGGPPAELWARWLVVVVAAASFGLVALVGWVRTRWQLLLHLVFDLLWIAGLLYCTGGVGSPGVVLLFAVVLEANWALPGFARFLVAALACLALAGNAMMYLAGQAPFAPEILAKVPGLVSVPRILGNVAVQVAAVFLVDLLAQLLARRLQEQRIFTGELLDQLAEGVIAVDRGGRIAYANAEAQRLLGLARLPAGGEACAALAGPRLQPVCELLQHAELPRLERFAGPGDRQLVLRVSPLADRRGQPLGRILLIADETRLRLLEENAQRAEHLAALGEMAAGIAHEVRNPLTSLRGCAQELGEISRRASQPDAATLAGILVAEADRLDRIVGDFLAFSRLRRPEPGRVELAALLAEVARLTAARSDLPAGIRLSFSAAAGCPPVQADAGQLRQIIDNLVGNALDALRAAAAPALTVAAAAADAGEGNPLPVPAVRLVISDNGCGIPVEMHERVFTPFYSTKAQGTGLGLSLVSRIVREHEGMLHLDSAPGRGTTIAIFLPAHSQTRTYVRALGAR